MRMKNVFALLLTLAMLFGFAVAEEAAPAEESAPALAFEPLPMDRTIAGPQPDTENFVSDFEYVDESISVKIYQDRYADTDYYYAHIKIVHPSQLRTAPAQIERDPEPSFRNTSTGRGRIIAHNANAVIALNGDYHSKSDKCRVVLRMGKQLRNTANGVFDLLIIDNNGDFSCMKEATKDEYNAYYEANKENLYQVFCFGPVLCEDGVSVITEEYENRHIGAKNCAQRSAFVQLGPLEYMMVTSLGPQSKNNKGMTIYEFAQVCEMAGKSLNENGCLLAFNLDGGNSATMNFRRLDPSTGKFRYYKVNCPEIERPLSDIIYFATLVK